MCHKTFLQSLFGSTNIRKSFALYFSFDLLSNFLSLSVCFLLYRLAFVSQFLLFAKFMPFTNGINMAILWPYFSMSSLDFFPSIILSLASSKAHFKICKYPSKEASSSVLSLNFVLQELAPCLTSHQIFR